MLFPDHSNCAAEFTTWFAAPDVSLEYPSLLPWLQYLFFPSSFPFYFYTQPETPKQVRYIPTTPHRTL